MCCLEKNLRASSEPENISLKYCRLQYIPSLILDPPHTRICKKNNANITVLSLKKFKCFFNMSYSWFLEYLAFLDCLLVILKWFYIQLCIFSTHCKTLDLVFPLMLMSVSCSIKAGVYEGVKTRRRYCDNPTPKHGNFFLYY